MSYWSENPEKYSEICNTAIARKLASYHPASLSPSELELDLCAIVEEMQHDAKARGVRDMLLLWANAEIIEEEQDYWAAKTDEAMIREER